jgi:hypothetical protein
MLEYLCFATELIPRCLRAVTYELSSTQQNFLRVVQKHAAFRTRLRDISEPAGATL